MRERIDFNNDWYFTKSDIDSANEIAFSHECWRRVRLPHDWSVESGFDKYTPSGAAGGYLDSGVGWYRKAFSINGDALCKRVLLEFDGAFMNSKVWINGALVGERSYGYISYAYNITELLAEGVNIIAVRLDCLNQPQSRWYNGCGINRNVWLTVTDRLYVEYNGLYVKTPRVGEERAFVQCETEIINDAGVKQCIELESIITDKGGIQVQKNTIRVTADVGKNTYQQSLPVEAPRLWSPEAPEMYTISVGVYREGALTDQAAAPFGIREAEFIPRKGLFVNGVEYKLRGVCLHHDGGVTGAAVPQTVWRKRLKLLKDMGCNAIRTAHNPFAPEFYDLCDNMGFFVLNELFDGWEKPKAAYDYGLYFEQWHERDAEGFIRRDRNHPCVVLWSIGNEVWDMPVEITKKLLGIFHRLDPARPVTCGVQGAGPLADQNRALLGVAGYNDGGGACFVYARDHGRRPDQLMVATESPHTFQTRGFYRTQTWWRDKNQPRVEIPNLTEDEIFFDGDIRFSSSYDNCGVRLCARDAWGITESAPYLIGEFRWCGFDYYGESDGWPMRRIESGVIDCANFRKDHYYLYQSMWTDPAISPMVHLLPHWTHPRLAPGTEIPVWVYTNCEEAELYLNGVSLGRRSRGKQRHLQWDVGYAEGELTAAGYMNAKQVCAQSYFTAGEPSRIKLDADTGSPAFDGVSTMQVDCTVCDANGVMVPHGENTVHFAFGGMAELVGTENGNMLDLTRLSSPARAAFNGLCALTVRMRGEPGEIRVVAGAILGEKMFAKSAAVSIDVQELRWQSDNAFEYDIYYTTDLSEPDEHSTPYTGSFVITRTTAVKAVAYRKGARLLEMRELFFKGEREPAVDLIHGNKPQAEGKPCGPFSGKAQGQWSDGGFVFWFKEDGELIRRVGVDGEQKLGYWWYDYPADVSETPNHAGTGEIWYHSGEKAAIHMPTQAAEEIIIDNAAGALSTVYGFSKTITLRKI